MWPLSTPALVRDREAGLTAAASNLTGVEELAAGTLTALTTEHFGLAGARSQAAGESASRSALYLGSVSSTLVGLGLTAQVSGAGGGHEIFYVFALVALPTLFALGAFTFVRLVELGMEDFLLGRAINRIRHLYIEQAGDAARYFVLSGHDDAFGVVANMGIRPSRLQLYFTAAMAVATVNAVVAGAAVAIAVGRITSAALWVCLVAGAVVAVLAFATALVYQDQRRGRGTDVEALFPSPSPAG